MRMVPDCTWRWMARPGILLFHLLRKLGARSGRSEIQRWRRFDFQQAQRAGGLNHAMSENQWIDDIAADDATPSTHPHWMIALSHIDQIVDHHQPVTPRTTHMTLLCQPGLPTVAVASHTTGKQTECHRTFMLSLRVFPPNRRV